MFRIVMYSMYLHVSVHNEYIKFDLILGRTAILEAKDDMIYKIWKSYFVEECRTTEIGLVTLLATEPVPREHTGPAY